MTIEYLICDNTGRHIETGTFNSTDARAFAIRAKQAWLDGHSVITRAKQ